MAVDGYLDVIEDNTDGWERGVSDRVLPVHVGTILGGVSAGRSLEVESLRAAGADDSRARLALGRARASQRRLLRDNSWLRRRPERERAYGDGGRAVDVRPLSRQALTKDAVLDATEGIYRAAGVSRSRVGRALSAMGFDPRTATPSEATSAVRNVVRGIRRDKDSAEAHRLIVSGAYPLSVRRAKQEEHILGTEARARRMAKVKDGDHGPSIVNMSVEDAQALVNECSGHGIAKLRRHADGSVELSELCIHPNRDIIGIYVNDLSGLVTETDTFVIKYSKRHGTHIVPAVPTWMRK